MINDKDSTCDEQPSFQVVLIDIQKAAKNEIYCVKKTLTKELKYVAISYRWGELLETSIDTRVGYVASITSFALEDFYKLCATMTKEPDLQTMDYVWLDTICVNQSNHDERKATIYHMTEIYEHASWILAVPDLHAAHLRTMTNHKKVMASIQQHQAYLYHLLHGNIKELYGMDATFLDSIGVPRHPDLRQLMTKYTQYFADGFTRASWGTCYYPDAYVLAHLFEKHSNEMYEKCRPIAIGMGSTPFDGAWMNKIRSLHKCNDGDACPFENSESVFDLHRINGGWHISIIERSNLICQAMHFLKDLVVDWSSRVWVISEFHIAKKKNNLKFWFNQLNNDSPALTFFNFDMDDPRLKTINQNGTTIDLYMSSFLEKNTVYYVFYLILINQLNKQTFLEMMLKSKASKNEDRFYSIFPLFPQYKDLLQANNNLVNNVNSILSVKLKLYQVMANEHKEALFYFSATGTTTYTLPTFATTLIDWQMAKHVSAHRFLDFLCSDIALFYETTIDNGSLYYLRVKPRMYYVTQRELCTDTAAGRTLTQLLHTKRKTLRLETDDADTLNVDLIRLGRKHVYLIGSLNENIWILSSSYAYRPKNEFKAIDHLPDDFSGFCVY